jgi:soluble cytochrome b562
MRRDCILFRWQASSEIGKTNLVALRIWLRYFSPGNSASISSLHMKIRLLFASLICALATVPCLQAQPAGHDEDTELGDKMYTLSSAYKKLGKQINDASKNEDSLKLVATIHSSAEAALKLEPAKKADIPAADQAKFVTDYQAKMKSFIGEVDKLEAALKAGDNAAAAKQLDVLKQAQREGHKEFQKKKQPGK